MRSYIHYTATVLVAMFILAHPSFGQEEEAPTALPETNEAASDLEAESTPEEVAVLEEEETDAYENFYFLGRFHPLVLHFPIGLLIALFILELAAIVRRTGSDGDIARWILLLFGTAMAILAAVLGWFLEWTGGYNEDVVFTHRWSGVVVAVAAFLALLLRVQFSRSFRDRYIWTYRLALLVSVGALIPSGHSGASLTHGSTYLTKYLPEQLAFLEPVLGEVRLTPAGQLGSSAFEKNILPIFEAKCFECHGPDKQKGDYRMDTRERCVEGGESNKAGIVPGSATASYLVETILLPPEHEHVMPPVGEKALEASEVMAIVEWVNRGAPWGEYTPPDPAEIAVLAAARAEELAGEEVATLEDSLSSPLVDCAEVMQIFFEIQYESLRTTLWKEPQRRAEFKVIYNSVFELAEAHNLLFSRSDEEYMFTQAWVDLTIKGRSASLTLGESVKNRDYEAMKTNFVALGNSCNVCHEKFIPDEDPISIIIEEAKEEEEKPARRRRDR